MSLNQSTLSRPKADSMFLSSDGKHLRTRNTSETEKFTFLFTSLCPLTRIYLIGYSNEEILDNARCTWSF